MPDNWDSGAARFLDAGLDLIFFRLSGSCSNRTYLTCQHRFGRTRSTLGTYTQGI